MSDATQAIKDGYTFDADSIELGVLVDDGSPSPDAKIRISLSMLNRHGLVAGATGTGKTKTLQLMAEQISKAGVPVFAADIKGDLSGLAIPGQANEKLLSRTAGHRPGVGPGGNPVEFYALGGEGTGVPLRATISRSARCCSARCSASTRRRSRRWRWCSHYADQTACRCSTSRTSTSC
jgi:hypothetical protein